MMQPIGLAMLSSHTPPDVIQRFADERVEEIPFEEETDLVAIAVETYTARRAYRIADCFRQKDIPVVLGGFHPSALPDEAALHADTVVVGPAEDVWAELIQDARNNSLRKRYGGNGKLRCPDALPNRELFRNRAYVPLALVEASRGCPYSCDFCAIAVFYNRRYASRSIEAVVEDIRRSGMRFVFFTDDNFAVDIDRTYRLLEAIRPLKIRWAAQATLDISRHPGLLDAIRKSGGMMLLTGFESLSADTLKSMNKLSNTRLKEMGAAADVIQNHGIALYATFVFGYDSDSVDTFHRTLDFAKSHRFFFCAFNHLVPFPGTPLFHRLAREERLMDPQWWLSRDYHFGDVVFHPLRMTAKQLAENCLACRREFYKPSTILHRMTNRRSNCRDPLSFMLFLTQNISLRREIERRGALNIGEGR